MSDYNIHIEPVEENEYSLHIEPVGENEYALSITIESVYAENVLGAGNFISKNMWVGTWTEYLELGGYDNNTLYLITTPTGTGLPVVSVYVQNAPQLFSVEGYVLNGIVSFITNAPQTLHASISTVINGIVIIENYIQSLVAAAEHITIPYEDRADYAYGVLIDETQPSPQLTRIGNQTMAQNADVNSQVMMGLLNSDTGVLKLLDPDDARYYADGSGLAPVDGSAGNIMSYMPPFYYNVEQVTSSTYNLWVTKFPIMGFSQHPGWCLGATKAVINNDSVFGKSTGAMWSIVNESVVFRGGSNSAVRDGQEAGFLGKPRTRLIRQAYFEAAQLQGSDFGIMHYKHFLALSMLYITKYGNFNSQLAPSAKVNGYYAGGIGIGVTDVLGTEWNTYNGYYPLVKTGVTLQRGLNDGQVAVTLNEWPVAPKTVYEHVFMGIQGVASDIATAIQGINLEKVNNAGTYVHTAHIYDDYMDMEEIITTPTRSVQYSAASEGYLKSIMGGAYFDILVKTRDNSSDPAVPTSYWCDYFFNPVTSGDVGIYGAYTGGYATREAQAGINYFSTVLQLGVISQFISSRLAYYGTVVPTL